MKNLPSKYLCVVSKTNIISAEVLASKLTYSAPIIHQEANSFSKEAFLDIGPEVEHKYATLVSLDIIGAAIYKEFEQYSNAHFNLFNKSLGDIYTMDQPPEFNLGGSLIVLTNALLIKLFIFIACVVLIPCSIGYVYLVGQINSAKDEQKSLEAKAAQIEQFLKDNENISSELFDEGYEIRMGLEHNKGIYSYYTIVGTEIPKKLWLTHLHLSDKTTIEGQADNLESVYAFFRSIKDYDPNSDIKLQKLGLAAQSNMQVIPADGSDAGFDTDSILTSLNADYYEFVISDEAPKKANTNNNNNKKKQSSGNIGLPELEPLE